MAAPQPSLNPVYGTESYFGGSKTFSPRASAGRMCWNSIDGTLLIFFAPAGSFVESAFGLAPSVLVLESTAWVVCWATSDTARRGMPTAARSSLVEYFIKPPRDSNVDECGLTCRVSGCRRRERR